MTLIPDLEHKIIARENYALHYFAKGDPRNELIIFLHPAFGDHKCFYQQIDFFAEHYRVVAVDMIGHGESQVKDSQVSIADTSAIIAEIIAREGHVNAHLVGVSLGSLIAQDVAARFPNAVQTLTVLGGYTIFGASKEIQRAQVGEMLKWFFLIIVSMPLFRRYLARTTVIHPQAQEMFYRSTQLFTRRSLQALSGMNKVLRPVFQPQHHPLQIMVGDHDLPLMRRVAEALHQQEPTSEYHSIGNAGHCANMDNPDDFNALLLRFVARHSLHQSLILQV